MPVIKSWASEVWATSISVPGSLGKPLQLGPVVVANDERRSKEVDCFVVVLLLFPAVGS